MQSFQILCKNPETAIDVEQAWSGGELHNRHRAPKSYGDAARLELTNSGFLVFISTRYHQRSTADDARLTHQRDLPTPLSFREARSLQSRPGLHLPKSSCGGLRGVAACASRRISTSLAPFLRP